MRLAVKRDIVEARQHLYDEGGADGQSGREVSILTVSPSGLGGVRQREGSLLLTLYVPQAQKAGGCYPGARFTKPMMGLGCQLSNLRRKSLKNGGQNGLSVLSSDCLVLR